MQYNKSEGFVKSSNLSDFWNQTVDYSVAAHDTTGGMETKISEAAMIAKLGVDVYIVKAATTHSQRALNGDLRDSVPEDWLGTIIRFSK
jgi:isopentenyl phosphate kinase